MAFWTGLEGLTGHRPGAFSGFRMRDILDKDNEKILMDTMPIQWFGKTFHRNKSLS